MSIHPTALIEPGAEIDVDVTVGAFSIIHSTATIGASSVIGSHCAIGVPTGRAAGVRLRIGANALIRSHSVFYQGSSFGRGLTTGHGVVVREGTVAGEALQVGTNSEIQGDCVLGDHVRTQSDVFISQGASIGNFVWLLPRVVLTNDPQPPSDIRLGVCVSDFAVIAAGAVVLPGVTIGRASVVGASALVASDVPAGALVHGSPARVVRAAEATRSKDGTNRPAYPWTKHFHRGYPEEIVERWKSEG